MTPVTHYPPRKLTHITRKQHNRQLGWCFVASIAFMAILALVSLAWGQDHPFPFKTLEDITTGTPAWVISGPPQLIACPPDVPMLLSRFLYRSGSGTIWAIFTDGNLFTAAYFPSETDLPVTVVEGQIVDGKQVIIKFSEPFDNAKHRYCNPWRKKSAMEG